MILLRSMLRPPFESVHELFSLQDSTGPPPSPVPAHQSTVCQSNPSTPQGFKLVLPSFYQDKGRELLTVDRGQEKEFRNFLKRDLDVERLNKIHKHLWFAGLPLNARALHYQIMVGREIVLTERADFHMLWRDKRLFLKPLPDYLLSHDIWKDALCKDRALYEDASGFLLSYLWLIRHKSDLTIAHDAGLLCREMTWERWTSLSQVVISKLEMSSFRNISPRYLYGELRLGRINLIYRFCRKTTNFTILIRGYQYGYHQYSTLLKRNFAWVLTAIIYITIVLTAMQVGLATNQLSRNVSFNRASYGFTVFSILAPLAVFVIAIFTVLVLVAFNWKFSLERRSEARKEYAAIFTNETLRQYSH